VREITGLPLSAHYGASKLKWCLDEIPSVRKALAAGTLAWGPLASYLLYGLLEEQPLSVDPANAARTLLWDLNRRDWSLEMLDLFELPLEALPACVYTRTHYGCLRAAGKRIPLRVCTGDQSAVPFAAGWPESGRVTVNAGTGAFIQRSTGEQAIASQDLLTSIIYTDEHRAAYTLEGTVNGAGAAIETMAGELGIEPETALGDLDLADPHVPVFINGIGGLGSPFWRPDLLSRFEGDGSPRQKLQAVFESILFLIQTNLDALRAATGPVEQIILTGGLAREAALRQGLADLSGIPVLHPPHAEATARGVAFLLNTLNPEQGRSDSGPQGAASGKASALARRYRRWQEAMARALDDAAN
jgi:glycerol kinase